MKYLVDGLTLFVELDERFLEDGQGISDIEVIELDTQLINTLVLQPHSHKDHLVDVPHGDGTQTPLEIQPGQHWHQIKDQVVIDLVLRVGLQSI